jgi:hypothetical protein
VGQLQGAVQLASVCSWTGGYIPGRRGHAAARSGGTAYQDSWPLDVRGRGRTSALGRRLSVLSTGLRERARPRRCVWDRTFRRVGR